MTRQVRTAAFAVAVMLVLSSLALARDDDDDYGRRASAQAQQYGFQDGYRDGLSRGQKQARDHDFGDFRSRDWDKATHGYQSWMGSRDDFRDGYRDGYRQGYEAAFRDGDGDRDRGLAWRGGPVLRGGGAYNFGYQDGIDMGRLDFARHKNFNPRPRGDNHADRGYRPEFGDIHIYRDQYADGYRVGYESSFGRF